MYTVRQLTSTRRARDKNMQLLLSAGKKAHTQSKHVIGSSHILWILRKLLMLF